MGKVNAFFSAVVLCFASMASAQDITGSGTKGYIPKFNGSTTVTNSRIFQDGTGVGINTATPGATLDVNGTVNAATGFNLGGQPFAFGSITSNSVFVGFAGNQATSAVFNTALGFGALQSNTTGNSNSALGRAALASNSTGNGNTATGDGALYSNSSGSYNTASGDGVLVNNLSGWYNTASGWYALGLNTSGSSNTAIGYGALPNNTVGGFNTATGYNAGATLDLSAISGTNNTLIGAQSGLGTGSLNNAAAIGAFSVVGESNALVLGSINGLNGATSSVSVGIGTTTPGHTLDVVGDGNFSGCVMASGSVVGGTCSSDARLKTNIRAIEPSLDKLAELQPVRFNWRAENPAGYRYVANDAAFGLVAQQVEEVFPDMVSSDKNGYKRVDYGRLPYMLLAGVKELKARSDALSSQVQEQQTRLEQQQQQIDRLMQQLQQVQAVLKDHATLSLHVAKVLMQ